MKKVFVLMGMILVSSNFIVAQAQESAPILISVEINESLIDRTRIRKSEAEDLKKMQEEMEKQEEEDMKKQEEEEKKNAKEDQLEAGQLQNVFSEYWVQFLALIVSVIGVGLAVSGFSLVNKNKQKNLKKFLHEIDDAYTSYKWKTKRCEAELYRLLDLIEDELKEGKIDESTYGLLEKRINKYLDEIKYAEERPPQRVKDELEKNAERLEKKIDEAGKLE
jgi:hypothetical protein